jgi:hypothetical protein
MNIRPGEAVFSGPQSHFGGGHQLRLNATNVLADYCKVCLILIKVMAR